MNVRLLALAGAVAGILAGSQVSAQPLPANAQAPMHLRGDRGSDRNLVQVRRRVEGLIDQLQRDQRDYSGHRAKAIDDLQMARNEIEAALRADTSDRDRR